MASSEHARSPRVRHFASLLARTTNRSLPSEEVVHLAVELVARVTGTEVASLYAHDSAAGELVLAATYGLSRSAVGHVTLHIGEGMSGRAALDRVAVMAADVASDPTFRLITAFDQIRYRSLLAVPMVWNDQLIGTVNVQTLGVHVYDDEEIELLLGIGAVLAPLVSSLWHDDLPARLRGPSAAARLEAGMATATTETEVAHLLVKELGMLFPLHAAGVSLRGPRTQRITAGTFSVPMSADGTIPLDLVREDHGGAAVRLHDSTGPRGLIVLGALEQDAPPFPPSALRLVETLGAQMIHGLETHPAISGGAAPIEVDTALSSLIKLVLDDVGLDAVLARSEALCVCPLAVTDAGGLPVAGAVPAHVVSNIALRVAGTIVGRLLAPVTVETTPALNAAAHALALELSKWQNRFEVERTLRAEGLDVLLSAQGDERELAARARALGIELTLTYVPIVVAFDVDQLTTVRGPLALAALSRMLQRAFGTAESSVCFVRPDGLLVLARSSETQRLVVDARFTLDEVRRSAPGLSVAIGMAEPVCDIRSYAEAVRRAAIAASIALRRGSTEPLDAADLGVDQLFLHVTDESVLQRFVDRELGVLMQQDASQATEWIRTLEAQHLSGEKLRIAASAIFVHVNTLKYRLDRISELTGRDLRNPHDRFIIHLALHARRYLDPLAPSLLSDDAARHGFDEVWNASAR